MNRLTRLMIVLIVCAMPACNTEATGDEFIWDEYRGCKYYYKREEERLTAMYISCTLPYERAAVVDAMQHVLSRAYGEKVFSEPYSKNNKVCMAGREHAYCAVAGGSLQGGIISLSIDRTSALRLMEKQ